MGQFTETGEGSRTRRSEVPYLALFVTVLVAGCGSDPRAEPPNIVLVTVDTLRADRLGCYGYPRATTPAADRLAREGTKFTQAIVQIPETLPSIVSMMTSAHPIDHGVRQNGYSLPPELPTLAEILKAEGWQTAAFVSSVILSPQTGIGRGFETYDVDCPIPFLLWPLGQRRAKDTTDAAIAWLRRRTASADGSFFLWVHYIDPHSLYAAPEPFLDRFVKAPYEGKVTGDPEQFLQIVAKFLPLEPADIEFLGDRYDGEVAYADAHLGRLVDALSNLGLDHTLVVYTADHGESLGEHEYYFDHGEFLYDDQIRVPLIVRHPDLPRDNVVDQQVQAVDFMPTILDFAGVDAGTTLRGRSLLPLIRGETQDRIPTMAFSESDVCRENSIRSCAPEGIGGKLFSIRAGRWKLIQDPSGPIELFDLRADPVETRNRIEEETEVAQFLHEQLSAFIDGDAERGHFQNLDPDVLAQLKALGYGE